MSDRWTPVARGLTYCAPACGFGCTLAAFHDAVAAAEKLAARVGNGFAPRVWENLGWHYEIVKGTSPGFPGMPLVSVSEPRAGRFIVFLNTSPQFVEEASDPLDGVGFAIQRARTMVRRVENDVASILCGDEVPS